MSPDPDTGAGPRPGHLLPLVRHLSRLLTPLLLGMPITPNHITLAALVAGLASAWSFTKGVWSWSLIGALCLILCYVLDNCDGEVARIKHLCSPLGALLDTAVDTLVHTALLAALGLGVTRSTGNALWMWLGLGAAAGALVDASICLSREARHMLSGSWVPTPPLSQTPLTFKERILYAFRELSRADFCFIVAALAFFNLVWLLLPTAAAGAQLYWLTSLRKDADRFHV